MTQAQVSQANVSLALITGGSRGLGRSMVLELADRGIDSIFTYHSNEKAAMEVAGAVEKRGRKAVALKLDVGAVKTFPAFAETLKAELRRVWKRDTVDALVNNGGAGHYAPIASATEAQFDELMNMHLKGPFFLVQTLLPLIADGGRVVNITTGLTRFSYAGYAPYAAMKGGLEVLTRYMATEFGARRISVNSLAPGAIETDFGGGAVRDNAELNKQIASQTALGRVGQPDDVGRALALLLSPGSNWINGQRIEVAGGIYL